MLGQEIWTSKKQMSLIGHFVIAELIDKENRKNIGIYHKENKNYETIPYPVRLILNKKENNMIKTPSKKSISNLNQLLKWVNSKNKTQAKKVHSGRYLIYFIIDGSIRIALLDMFENGDAFFYFRHIKHKEFDYNLKGHFRSIGLEKIEVVFEDEIQSCFILFKYHSGYAGHMLTYKRDGGEIFNSKIYLIKQEENEDTDIDIVFETMYNIEKTGLKEMPEKVILFFT
jgi:hypothetical protein